MRLCEFFAVDNVYYEFSGAVKDRPLDQFQR